MASPPQPGQVSLVLRGQLWPCRPTRPACSSLSSGSHGRREAVGGMVGPRVGMTAPDSASQVDQDTQEGQVERAPGDLGQPPHCQ